MVLLIPATYKWIKEKGIAEGKAEGIAEGEASERKAQRKRLDEAYRRFGFDVNGVLMLPNTPEVKAFLSGDASSAHTSQ